MGGAFLGYSHTKHIFSSHLNDAHPKFGYESDHLGFTAYINSFYKESVAVYWHDAKQLSSKVDLTIKAGVTTGYKKELYYNGRLRRLRSPFLTDGVMFSVVPGVEYNFDQGAIMYEQVGEAISFGYKINLN